MAEVLALSVKQTSGTLRGEAFVPDLTVVVGEDGLSDNLLHLTHSLWGLTHFCAHLIFSTGGSSLV